MKEKTCKICGKVKPIEDYHRHKLMLSGYLNQCKVCINARARAHRAANIEELRKRDIWRNKNQPHRRKANFVRSKNWLKRNPEKAKAHDALNGAVRSGRIKRLPCEICGSGKVHGHHEDYSKPLDVIWLCSIHHAQIHRVGAEKLLEGQSK